MWAPKFQINWCLLNSFACTDIQPIAALRGKGGVGYEICGQDIFSMKAQLTYILIELNPENNLDLL